jgi:hypothetical protein
MALPARLQPANWRAALWAVRALRHTRRELRARGVHFLPPPPAPPLPEGARRGVTAVLDRAGATCLERAAVVQAWETNRGLDRDVVVGVARDGEGFHAHAWLDGDEPGRPDFTELLRVPAGGLRTLPLDSKLSGAQASGGTRKDSA